MNTRREVDAALAPLTTGLNLSLEQDRALFRVRVFTEFRAYRTEFLNLMLTEGQSTHFAARHQLAREYLDRLEAGR